MIPASSSPATVSAIDQAAIFWRPNRDSAIKLAKQLQTVGGRRVGEKSTSAFTSVFLLFLEYQRIRQVFCATERYNNLRKSMFFFFSFYILSKRYIERFVI